MNGSGGIGRLAPWSAPRGGLRHPLARTQLFELRIGLGGPTPPAVRDAPRRHPPDPATAVHDELCGPGQPSSAGAPGLLVTEFGETH